jgi:hypothetical protein
VGAEPCPWKQRQAKIDRGRVQRIQIAHVCDTRRIVSVVDPEIPTKGL